MESKFAFFNVDCIERSQSDSGFCFRPRVVPIGQQVDRLQDFAKEKDVRVVFTTCCDGRMLTPEEADDILYVPVDDEETGWLSKLDQSRVIYLHKLAWGTPKDDIKHVAWDMFLHNRNAAKLISALDIPEWVVFGNGMDLCVSSAAKGILKVGYKVTLIEDVMISSAGGTPESKEKTLNQLCEAGARRMPLEKFFEEFGK